MLLSSACLTSSSLPPSGVTFLFQGIYDAKLTSSSTQKPKTRDLHPGEMLFSNILTLEPGFNNVQFQALKTQAPLTRKVERVDYVSVYSDTHLCVNGAPRNEFKQDGSSSYSLFQRQQPHGLLAAAAAVPAVTSCLHPPLPPSLPPSLPGEILWHSYETELNASQDGSGPQTRIMVLLKATFVHA